MPLVSDAFMGCSEKELFALEKATYMDGIWKSAGC